MKLVGRGDTTVVDAYLSPILRAYVDRVAARGRRRAADVHAVATAAWSTRDCFQGKDAILSGPAGGIVGAARTAAAGRPRADRRLRHGRHLDRRHPLRRRAFERAFDTEVAGVRMRAPMMKIHTVAAGGGSIVSFDGQRFRVGPESAGANPGPACYRRGGPLAVTDANLMVGKLAARLLPAPVRSRRRPAAGRRGGARRFAELAHEVEAADRRASARAEELAHGCLAIANDNMANAIKEISVQRGIDVTRYALVLLRRRRRAARLPGGRPLGIARVFDPPASLGALGLRHGAGRRARHCGSRRSSGRSTTRRRRRSWRRRWPCSAPRPRPNCKRQDVPPSPDRGRGPGPPALRRHRHLARGAVADAAALRPPSRPSTARATASSSRAGASSSRRSPSRASADGAVVEPEPTRDARRSRWSPCSPRRSSRPGAAPAGRAASQAAVYDARGAAARRPRAGPALVCGATTTVVVEPGWRAGGDRRATTSSWTGSSRCARQVAVGTHCDPILLEIFNNLFMTIAEQMGVTLQNTAYSVNVKERLDFSCAVFDADGGAGRQRAAHAGAPGLDGRVGARPSSRCNAATAAARRRLRARTTPTTAAPTCPTSPS